MGIRWHVVINFEILQTIMGIPVGTGRAIMDGELIRIEN